MELESRSFDDGDRIPEEYAFCAPDTEEMATGGGNRNPHLAWSDVPDGTRSFAVFCVDPDVPSVGEDVNVEGKTVPADLERTDFYHWVLLNVPPSVREIEEGRDSMDVTPGGKAVGQTAYGVRGKNDYTAWFADDDEMAGSYGGYDGPCPPWNDEIVHHYHFRVYALDVPAFDVDGDFSGAEAMEAIQGHVLDQAEIVGTYTLNPDLL